MNAISPQRQTDDLRIRIDETERSVMGKPKHEYSESDRFTRDVLLPGIIAYENARMEGEIDDKTYQSRLESMRSAAKRGFKP